VGVGKMRGAPPGLPAPANRGHCVGRPARVGGTEVWSAREEGGARMAEVSGLGGLRVTGHDGAGV
jgi:hypothetical protein